MSTEPIAPPFEFGLFGQFLIAALPGKPGRIQHALQRMARDAEFFAVISQQIMEGFLAVIDAVVGILFDFPDSEVRPRSRRRPLAATQHNPTTSLVSIAFHCHET